MRRCGKLPHEDARSVVSDSPILHAEAATRTWCNAAIPMAKGFRSKNAQGPPGRHYPRDGPVHHLVPGRETNVFFNVPADLPKLTSHSWVNRLAWAKPMRIISICMIACAFGLIAATVTGVFRPTAVYTLASDR